MLIEALECQRHTQQIRGCFVLLLSAGEWESAARLNFERDRRIECIFLLLDPQRLLESTWGWARAPLDLLDVSLIPEEPARLFRVEGNPSETGRWFLSAFATIINAAGALQRKAWLAFGVGSMCGVAGLHV